MSARKRKARAAAIRGDAKRRAAAVLDTDSDIPAGEPDDAAPLDHTDSPRSVHTAVSHSNSDGELSHQSGLNSPGASADYSDPADDDNFAASPASAASSNRTAASKKSSGPWRDTRPFQHGQRFKSALPIFRRGDVKEYNAVETLSDDERAKLTFAESLDYYLRLPANAIKRNKSLISDRQYIDLLHQCTGNQTVAEQMREREQVDVTWLYNQVKAATYRRVDMDFKVADDRTDSGPVLVTFVEPADGKGESYKRRHPSSRDQLTLSMMRRCIPYSQLQAAIELGHIGPLGVGHVGQDNTYINCSRLFDGVSRHLVRDYVKRCSVCQSKQTQQHQSAVKPLVSKALWERVVMDLVDFGESRRSRGFRYIWHAQDHFSKFNFVAPLMHKTADEVAGAVEAMLRVTGPIKILQCDNGTEFKGRVLDVCKEWKMDPPTHSSPYHPQTNGLIERAGSTLKTALDKWAEQFNTREWADGLSRISWQINCNISKATRRTPYELVFGRLPRWDSAPVDSPLDETSLMAILADEDIIEPMSPTFLASPPTEQAALLLADIHLQTNATGTRDSVSQYVTRTPHALRRTPHARERTPDEQAVVDEAVAAAAAVCRRAAIATTEAQRADTEARASDWEYQTECDAEIASAFQPDDDETTHFVDDMDVCDLRFGRVGPITRKMAEQLHAGEHKFWRLGAYGGGRCLLSAWQLVNWSGHENVPPLEIHLRFCDLLRAQLKSWLLQLSASETARMKKVIWHVGNSGVQSNPPRSHDPTTSDTEAHAAAMETSWDMLLTHLGENETALGWEALAMLACWKRYNVLLYTQVLETTIVAAGTKLAAQKWRAAKADGSERLELARQNKRKAGGSWKEQRCTTEAVLVPRVMVASQPFVVLFHRSQIEYHHKKRRNNTEFGVSSGGSGHYEALMANTAEPGQRALYDGMHWPDSPLHYHLLHIGNCYLAAQFNDLARVRMVRDDRGNDSASFKVPNAVGLRVGALTPVNRRGHTTALDIMPCIIVRVIGGDSSSTSSGAQPAKYKLLTPFGVLKGTFRVEDLVTVTLNSHPPLLELFNSFTAEELMAPTALGAQPIDLSRWGEITVDEAWAQTNSGKQPAAVDNSRRREVAPRTAAVAAETAIVSSLEEHRHAPSLFTTSSQAAPPPAAPSRAPFILRFVAINRAGDKFKAVWSDPPDHWTWETKTSVYKQGEAAWQLLEEYLDSTELDVSNVA